MPYFTVLCVYFKVILIYVYFLTCIILMVLVFILYIHMQCITFNDEVICYIISKMCLHIDNLPHVVLTDWEVTTVITLHSRVCIK